MTALQQATSRVLLDVNQSARRRAAPAQRRLFEAVAEIDAGASLPIRSWNPSDPLRSRSTCSGWALRTADEDWATENP